MGIIIRQSIKGTIANYIGVGIGFITTFFILTDYLTAEEIGLTQSLIAAAILLSGLSQLGTTSSMMRFYPYFRDEKNKDHGIFFWSLIIPFIGFIIFLTVFFLCKSYVVGIFSKEAPLFVEYFNFVIPIAFFMLYMSVFEINSNILMRITIPKAIREIGIRLMLLISYLLFGFKIINLDGLIIAFCATYGIAALLNVFYLLSLNKVSFKPDFKHLTKPLVRNFAFYTFFLIAAALAGNITPTLNSFFLSAKMGLVYTGIFTIANYIATVIEIPYRSLGAITQPQIAQAIKDNDVFTANKLCQKVSLHQFLVGSFIFLLIWINIDLLFQLLRNGDEYSAGKWVVFILAFSKLFNSSFSIGTSVLGYSKYYYFSLIFTAILTACSFFLNLKLIPLFGMNGAAFATLFSYTLYYLLLLSLVKWKIKTSPFSWNQLKTLVIICVLYLINWLWQKELSSLFYLNNFNALINGFIEGIIRTCVIIGIGVIAVYYWKISEDINRIIRKYCKKFFVLLRPQKNKIK